jgi:hypothetical protein
MAGDNHLKERARSQTRGLLAESSAFLSMPFSEKEKLYREVYQANYQRLARQAQPGGNGGLVRQAAVNPNDPTDPRNFENRRIDQAGQLTGEFIESVDFPGFVRDLTLAVFRGNLEVQHAQTDDFIRLLKAATASLTSYVNEIDDFSAYARLAESEPDRFQIALPPPPEEDEDEEEEAAPQTPTLLDSQGEPVDLGDNQIRAKILDTKVAMAQENRALLREVLLMGITRMIIRKGKIEAACVFDIKAKEKMTRQALEQAETVTSGGGNLGGGLNLGFVSFGGGRSSTTRETEISVSSAAGRTSTDLSAKITGSVTLEIESDYFRLDNFADMYRQIATPAAPGGAGAAPSTPAITAPATP